MKVPLHNPIKKPTMGPRKPRKPNMNKGMPSRDTAQGMIKQEDIFRNRTSPHLGITTDENIELFFGLTNAKVLQLSEKDRASKWLTIKGINKWLKRSGRMAIISMTMKKGSIIMPPVGVGYPPQRRLNRDANIYFRCIKTADAQSWLKKNEDIITGIDTTNENTEDIVHKEEEQEEQNKEEKEVIEQLKPQIVQQERRAKSS